MREGGLGGDCWEAQVTFRPAQCAKMPAQWSSSLWMVSLIHDPATPALRRGAEIHHCAGAIAPPPQSRIGNGFKVDPGDPVATQCALCGDSETATCCVAAEGRHSNRVPYGCGVVRDNHQRLEGMDHFSAESLTANVTKHNKSTRCSSAEPKYLQKATCSPG